MKHNNWVVLLITGILLILVAGCAVKPQGPPPEDINIIFSADTRGELYKCGCKSNQLGGLGRRATAIKSIEDGARILIDCGNFAPASDGLFYDLKGQAITESYDVMGYDAVNIGVNEINHGKDYILQANEELDGKLISANVLDPSGKLIVQPYITKDFGSLRIGIIGLVYHQAVLEHPSRGKKSTVITREPVEALETYLPEMVDRENCDLIIIAGWLQEKDIESIAEKFDGKVDVILNGYGFKSSERKATYAYYYRNPEASAPGEEAPIVKRDEENKVETSIILHKTGNSGKDIGKIYAKIVEENGHYKLKDFDGITLDMGDRFMDDPAVDAVLAQFHQKVRDNMDTITRYVIGQNVVHYCQDYPDYVGNRWCNDCHSDESMTYNRSAHNRAMQPLNQKKEQRNPDCLPCHTTGYGETGGYRDYTDTQHLLNVGCESCHGPAKEHLCLETQLKEAIKMNSNKKATEAQLALIEANSGDYDHKIRKEVPEEICLKCHTEEWSPNFDYEKLLPIVSHKEEAITGPPNDYSNVGDMASLKNSERDTGAQRDPGLPPSVDEGD